MDTAESTGQLERLGLRQESAEELYEDAPCGYLSTLQDGTIIRANRTFLAWTGYTRDILLSGRRLQDLLPVPAKMFYETHYRPLMRMQGFVREMALDLVCTSGALLPVLVNAVEHRDSADAPVVVRTTIYDATERRRYERELLAARRRAEQLSAVVEASGDAILLLSPEGRIQTWNGGAERLFGYTAEEACGQPMPALLVPGELREEYSRAFDAAGSGHEVQLVTVLSHRDGRPVDVSLSLTPHREAPGDLIAVSSIIRDITERRRAEQQLRQAERLQSVGTLAGGVAHEVNNQMTVVLGFGEFVLRALGPEHPQAKDLQQMVTAAARAARISQQLLAFSRQQLMRPEEFDLGPFLLQLAPTLGRMLGSENRLVIDPDQPEARVTADRTQVELVLAHLAMNARDAMAGGGELRIGIERIHLTAEDARLRPGDEVVPGPYVVLTASDTGIGMSQATLRRAFEPFFTTKELDQATGLGLSMAYGIVKQHGGQMWATSEPGQGTTIRIYLPELVPVVPV
ncbi:MAG TPA: PAS domain S-box protein [Gemmatimonadales bacterium]